jgi:glycosyltransferase involved in cell wall biosynthesis
MPERSYVVYGSVPWDGPWAVDQNLAHAIAARHPVVYIEPPISPLTPIRYGLTSSSAQQARALRDRELRQCERLQAYRPMVLPGIERRTAQMASRPALRAQVRSAVRQAGLAEPIVLAFRGLADLAGAAGEHFRIAVIMDHIASGASLMGRSGRALERDLRSTCEAADAIVVPSYPVRELLAERGFASERLPFGFAADLAPAFDNAASPPEYAGLPRPIIGYTGGIDDRLDFDLIVKLADELAGTIALVGAISPRLSGSAREALASRPNIRLLGPRPRTELPSYIRHLDVALMPYQDSEWIRYASPLKLWEYLYAGPPIVGTGCPELRRYEPPLVHFGEDPGHAVSLVKAVLRDGEQGRERRREVALKNTWDRRAARLDEIVDARLGLGQPHQADAGSPLAAAVGSD